MSRTYRGYTDQQVIDGAREVKSIAGLLKLLKLRTAGGNYYTIKRKLQQLKINTSHWTGQAWNKGEQLKDWSEYCKVTRIKPHLIKKRGHKCECCSNSKWMDKPINLECHHKDGNRTNNQYTNLQLLCPNCHSFTENYKRKNKK